MERRQLLTIISVTTNSDAGTGTLRAAITQANSNPGNDTIEFALPQSQLVISPITALPPLSDSGTVLDATSEATFLKQTPGAPLVVLSGAAETATSVTGLSVTGGNCTIKGLVVQNFSNIGISLSASPGDLVQNCYVGTSATGLLAAANKGFAGISVAANSCTIGGATAAARNVVSGNSGDGILISGNKATVQGNYLGVAKDGISPLANGDNGLEMDLSVGDQIGGTATGAGNVMSGNTFAGAFVFAGGATGDVFQGNFVGTDSTGTVAAPNGFDGIDIQDAASISIGGAGKAGNVLSGNGASGIFLLGSDVTNVAIEGNKIGVAADGTTALPNKSAGIWVEGAQGDEIGGGNITLGNIIANNGAVDMSPGVEVQSGQGIAILTNSIHDNTNGGISINPSSNAPDNNATIAAPILTLAQTAAGTTEVAGGISVNPVSGADDNFTVQFFANPTADGAGDFEGQTFIGQTTVTADVNGNANFDVLLPVGTTVGFNVTATLTQSTVQDTSEFSAPLPVTAAPTTDLVVSPQTSASPDLFGSDEIYTVTVTNNGTNADPNVVYTGAIDANSNFVQASASYNGTNIAATFANGTVTANLGTLAPNTSATVTIEVSPIDTGTISLASTAAGTVIDTNPSNNTNVVTTVTVNPSVNLTIPPGIGLTGLPNPVPVNGTLTYTVTVENDGPSVATNAVVVDYLPASVTIVDVNPSQGGFTENGNIITFNLGDLPIGSATITIDVTPTQVGQITNTATVSSSVANRATTNTTATVVTSVEKAVNLDLTSTVSPNPGTAGQPLLYTLSLTNITDPNTRDVPSDATGVVVSDQLPANIDPTQIVVTVNPSQASFHVDSTGLVTITYNTVVANSAPVMATISVVPLFSGNYTNTATVQDTAEINTGTAPTTVTTTVPVSPADLSVTIVANPSIAAVGSPLTYTVTVFNAGPSEATGVALTDLLPGAIKAGATFVASQGSASMSGSRINANLGTIASGHSATLTIFVTPSLSGVLTDAAATVSNNNIDTNTANNFATLSTLVSPSDLYVTGIASTNAPTVGDAFVYGFTVYNFGSAAAPNAGINIALPAGVAYLSSSSTQGFTGYSATANVLSAALGTLAPNSYAFVYVTVVPTATGTLKATATGFSSDYDPNAANNVFSVTTTSTNHPGIFALSSANYAGFENAGTVPITINRLNGTLGAVDVTYVTGDGTARSGVNYSATDGVIQFAAGQTSKTILVPVQDDHAITGNLVFYFAITGVDDGGSIGAPAGAAVTEVNVDRDLVPPLVTAVVPVEAGGKVAGFVVDFSKALNPATANNPNNYHLFLSGRDINQANTFFPVAVAYYASNNSVLVVPSQAMSLNYFYGLIVNGSTAGGVTDLSGNLLAGDASALAGRDYDALIGTGTSLTYYDSGNNLVTLNSAGDQMEVIRSFTGDPYEVQLLGSGGHATLSGVVRRIGASSGVTSIGEIDGLGAFGTTNTTGISTPPFYVAVSNFNVPMPVPQDINTAAVVGQLVPNGPAYVYGRIKAKAG